MEGVSISPSFSSLGLVLAMLGDGVGGYLGHCRGCGIRPVRGLRFECRRPS